MSVFLSGYEADFCDAESASVLFLWQNWQFYFKLHNPFISCTQISKNSWSAKSFFGGGEWYLTQQDCSDQRGILHFHNYIHFCGRLSKVQTIFQYHRMADGRLWYCGGGYGELDPVLRYAPWLPQFIASLLLRSIGKRGGVVASIISKDVAILKRSSGEEAMHVFGDYKVDAMRPEGARRYFLKREMVPISIYENRPLAHIREDTELLAAQLRQIAERMPLEVDKTLLIAAMQSLPLGIPGASAIALRDFIRQNIIVDHSESFGGIYREMASYIKTTGGWMRLNRSESDTLSREIGQLKKGIELLFKWLEK
ncbi:hypothetical protein FE840_000620 [Peteryoungia desertarenae]|uniref:Uncharacterized protein n=1 Tax=Peteryoungia desertarenae TaxID=1813451 RepID=A0ABX6QI34_9HYPH|nr:hypothetical protein [Peteryoungia desertarenae]QLF68183.1 hypothetical protein FE840_000620 [Peteryoungia desertarenae]